MSRKKTAINQAIDDLQTLVAVAPKSQLNEFSERTIAKIQEDLLDSLKSKKKRSGKRRKSGGSCSTV